LTPSQVRHSVLMNLFSSASHAETAELIEDRTTREILWDLMYHHYYNSLPDDTFDLSTTDWGKNREYSRSGSLLPPPAPIQTPPPVPVYDL